MSSKRSYYFKTAMISLLAISLPLLVVGRAALSVSLGIAFLLALALLPFREAVEGFKTVFQHRLVQIGAVILILWLLFTPFSLDPAATIGSWVLLVALVVAMAVFSAPLTKSSDDLDTFLRIFLGTMAGGCVVFGAAFVGLPELLGVVKFKGWEAVDPVGPGKPVANGFMLGLPLVVYAGYRLKTLSWRLIALAVALFILVLADLAGARSALAGFAAGVAVVGLTIAWTSKRTWLKAAVGLSVVAAVGLAVMVAMSSGARGGADQEGAYLPTSLIDYHRQMIWKFTWTKAWDAPLWGYGLNAVNHLPGAEENAPGLRFELIPSHPHNWVLELWAESGPMVMGLIFAFVLGLGFWLLKRYQRDRSLAILAAIGVYGIYWGSGLFNFSFWAPWWQASHLLIFTLCLCLATREQAEP